MIDILKEYVEKYDNHNYLFANDKDNNVIIVYETMEKTEYNYFDREIIDKKYQSINCRGVRIADIIIMDNLSHHIGSIGTYTRHGHKGAIIEYKVGDIIDSWIILTKTFEKVFHDSIEIMIACGFGLFHSHNHVNSPKIHYGKRIDYVAMGDYVLIKWDACGGVQEIYRLRDRKLHGIQTFHNRYGEHGTAHAVDGVLQGDISLGRCFDNFGLDGVMNNDKFTGTCTVSDDNYSERRGTYEFKDNILVSHTE